MKTPLETVEGIYADFAKGNVAGILDALSEDVEWEHDTLDHGIPWLRPGRGRGLANEFFGVLAKEFDIEEFRVGPFFATDSQVVVLCQMRAKIRSTGKTLNDHEAHVWTLGPSGQVVRFRHIADTHQHWLASRR